MALYNDSYGIRIKISFILGLMLLFVIPAVGFALDGSVSAGLQWSFVSAEYKQEMPNSTSTKIEEKFNAPGVQITGYVFFTPKFGLFANTTFLFPSTMRKKGEVGSFKDYDLKPNLRFIGLIGPAFRWKFHDKWTLRLDAGFSFMVGKDEGETASHNYSNTRTESSSLGIGTNFGIDFKITPNIFMALGSRFYWHFAGTRKIEYDISSPGVTNTNTRDGDLTGYSQLAFSPYFNVGYAF